MLGSSAWLEHSEQIYHSRSIRELVQGIWERYPDQARSILRARIFCNYDPGIFEQELVKVAAKRWSRAEGDRPPEGIEIRYEWKPLSLGETFPQMGSILTFHEVRALAEILSQRGQAPAAFLKRLFERDRPVGAVILGPTETPSRYQLLALGWNTNARNKTLHAEINALQNFNQKNAENKLPLGAKIFTTLSPCRMCAAAIYEAAEDPDQIEILYRDQDPGRFAKNLCLTHVRPW